MLAQTVDDVVDALETLAWSWRHQPQPHLADVLLALRDAARDASHAVAAIEDQAELRAWLPRCREREHEARQLSRTARTWLLVEQRDPQLAIRGHDVLQHADAALRACTQLRIRLDSHALA
jgi:nucleoid-associated protein YejK